MFWLELATKPDARGVQERLVKDGLFLSPLKKDQEVIYGPGGGSECNRNNQPDYRLVVLAKFLPKKYKYQVSSAWFANLTSEKFVSLAIDGIKCKYYGD